MPIVRLFFESYIAANTLHPPLSIQFAVSLQFIPQPLPLEGKRDLFENRDRLIENLVLSEIETEVN